MEGKDPLGQSASHKGQIPYLHLGGRLDELRDGDLVLLEPSLDKLGAADVDGAEDVPGVVLHEGAAVDDQGALRSVPQEAGQLLGVHHLAWEPVPSHNGPVPSMASGEQGVEGQGRDASTRLPKGNEQGVRGEQGSTRPILLTLLMPRMPTHCAEPGKRRKEMTTHQLGRTIPGCLQKNLRVHQATLSRFVLPACWHVRLQSCPSQKFSLCI